MKGHVKIFFNITSDDSEELDVESLWAVPCEEGYRVDNIPFYVKNIALDDVVGAEEIEGYLYADRVIRPSGHSTIRLWFSSKDKVQSTRALLKSIGCDSEISDNDRLVAVDVPPRVKYEVVKKILDAGEEDGIWEYQEACLGYL